MADQTRRYRVCFELEVQASSSEMAKTIASCHVRQTTAWAERATCKVLTYSVQDKMNRKATRQNRQGVTA